ncbi:MAG: hypothetical protein OQJ93_08750, partial [Ignavibacteriaceae bacterium]|nr:hypothetical protein [Ignavibacteriaceae bacterium]
MNQKKIFNIIIFLVSVIIGFITVKTVNSSQQYFQTSDEKVSEAFQSLEFWNNARAYPDEEIPSDAYITAINQSQNNIIEKPQVLDSVNVWHAIGPHNTGGRTNAIAFNPQNPNTIYAGSASGGLWRSFSGGTGIDAWHYVSTSFPVLGVSSIEFVPNDSNIIYIGTGEVYNIEGTGNGAAVRTMRGTYGIGILKSTDSGETWNQSLDWTYNSERGVWAVKINPLNYNSVWAATTDGTYRSYDSGITWQKVNDVTMAMDLIINPVDTNIVLTGNGNFASPGFGIYRTSDGGDSWAKITSGLPGYFEGKIQLDIYNNDPNIVYASIANGSLPTTAASWLCKSTDTGLTWSIVDTTDYAFHQGWYSHDVAINQWNPNELMVAGLAVWNSTDGGETIQQKSDLIVLLGRPPIGGPEGGPTYVHGDIHSIIQHPTNPSTYYFGTDGGVFKTTDFGETFQSCNGRYQTLQLYNGTSTSQQDSLFTVGGTQDNSTVIFDGDLAWIRVIGGDGSWSAVDATNDSIIYSSEQYLTLFRSTDRGSSYSDIIPPYPLVTSFIAPFIVGHNNSNLIYAGRDYIYKSTNAGISWFATNGNNVLDGNPALAMEISYSDENKVYVATAPVTNRSGIFITTNGGTSWTNITGSLPDRYPADIAVDPINDDIVFISFYGFGIPHIYKSIDSGSDWADVSDNLPDIPIPAVIVDPNNTNHIYIGTDIGVFVSTNGGGNWQDFNDGLPDVVQGMDLNICNANDVIRVMTHGNG